jgi:hypothetical protein
MSMKSLKRVGLPSRRISQHLVPGVVLLSVICLGAAPSTSCVSPDGNGGCYTTIGAAVAAASPGDVIKVKPGTYKESVVISKSLSLQGTNSNNTVIDATGLPNGIYIDGLDNPGLRSVTVSGFTVENANFEGILVTNADFVTLDSNEVTGNNVSLDINTDTCPGQPAFETGEGFDCGEGIHIMGVSHSTISNNVSENNSGGLLISDDTGKTHDNVITRNTIQNNPFDCGITLASHAPAPGSKAPHNGIVNNTVTNNQSTHNGYQVPGAGAGVGIFSDGSGTGLVSGNIIVNNQLVNNGIPGIAFHSHVGPNFGLPADNLSGNFIAGNYISGNGADVGDTPTPGPTGININSGGGGSPITGNIIWGNTIENEAVDVAVNTPGLVDIHLNDLLGSGQIGIANLGTGTVAATSNYWGCSAGPTSASCSGVSGPNVTFMPFLPKKAKNP